MKFARFLKEVFISRFWIKAISLLLAILVVVLLNV
jgi:hypothetical protein